MSKFIVSLIVLIVAVAAQACPDTCQGKKAGEKFPSCSGPGNRFYVCKGRRILYRYCSGYNGCLIKGVCGSCQDSCVGKDNGDYQSLDNPRPFYIHCENEFMSYRTCHPNEVFNAWTRKCECYEVFCEMGDGYQPSVCGGCGGYVKCEGGFAVLRRKCPTPRPYFCCHTNVCVTSQSACGSGCGGC